MNKYGKSKTTVKLLITLLVGLPIVSFISAFTMGEIFDVSVSELAEQVARITILFIFFGIVFAVYSFFSKPFNLQYLNRVRD